MYRWLLALGAFVFIAAMAALPVVGSPGVAHANSGWVEAECERQGFQGTYNGQDCSEYAYQEGEEILQKTSSVNAITGRTVKVLSCVYYSELGRARQPGDPQDCVTVEAAQKKRNTRLYGSQNPCGPATPATGFMGCRRLADGSWQPNIVKNQGWRNQQNLQNFGSLSNDQILVTYNGQVRHLYQHFCAQSCSYRKLDGTTTSEGGLNQVLTRQFPFTYGHDENNPFTYQIDGDGNYEFTGEYRFRSDGRVVFEWVRVEN